MLEILAIVFLSKKCSQTAKYKGYSGGLFGFLAIALWIVGEITGAILGSFAMQGNGVALVYVFALFGAGAGALIAWLIVSALKDKTVFDAPAPQAPNSLSTIAPISQPTQPENKPLDTIAPISQPAPPQKWCIKCGTQLQAGGRFCIKCGAPAQGV